MEFVSGRVNLPNSDGTVVEFRDISTKVRSDARGIEVQMNGSADLWERMSLEGRIDARTGRCTGNVRFRRLRPGPLVRRLAPDLPWTVEASDLDVTVRFASENWNTLRADFSGTLGTVHLGRGDGITVEGERFSGSVHMDPTRCAFRLSEMDLTQPRLKASVSLETGPLSNVGIHADDL